MNITFLFLIRVTQYKQLCLYGLTNEQYFTWVHLALFYNLCTHWFFLQSMK